MLQEHTFERLGGSQSVAADFRVVAATNRNLEDEVAAGRFRQDLYFRLNVVPISLPPLRSRRPDIVLLAERFLEHYSQKHGFRVSGFTEDAVLKLQRYTFPGNVRELEHIVERAVLQGSGRVITPDLIVTQNDPETAKESDLEKLLALPFRESVQAWERLLIDRALTASQGNKAEAARKLGVHRRLLYEKLGSDD